MNHDELLKRVAERAITEFEGAWPCATAEQIQEAEAALGFALPPLLAGLYREVGNGGFGPDYRFLPLIGSEGPTVVSAYRAERAAGHFPEGVLPVLDWGCAMYAAVDCTDGRAPVLLFEPNAVEDDWSKAWFLDTDSLSGWLEAWLSGTGWYEEEVMMSADSQDPQPWPLAKDRLG